MVKVGTQRHRAKPVPRYACRCGCASTQGTLAVAASRKWAVKETQDWALTV